MKIVVASDWHADWATLGVQRYEEVATAARQSAEHAIAIGAGAYLFPGDLSDPDTGGGSFRASALAIEIALVLAGQGIPSIWIAGNHDVCEDGTGATTLTPLKALEGVIPEVRVAETPRRLPLGDGLHILALPFVAASHGLDLAQAARDLWPSDPAAKVIVLGHLSIPGIVPGTETQEMPRGREVVFPFAETTRAAARVNGHYHRRQLFDPGDGGAPIIIPGALARLTFGEEDHEPGFVVLEV